MLMMHEHSFEETAQRISRVDGVAHLLRSTVATGALCSEASHCGCTGTQTTRLSTITSLYLVSISNEQDLLA
jgi:hypothetical protein